MLQKSRDHGREMPFNILLICICIYGLPNVIVVRERRQEEGERVKHEKTSQNCPYGHIFEKNQHVHFLMHGQSSWSTFNLHLMGGPKSLSFTLYLELQPWKCDHGKWPSYMGQLCGP